MMRLTIKTLYFDTVLKKEMNEGETLDVTDARGKILISAKVAEKTTSAAPPQSESDSGENGEMSGIEMNEADNRG